MSPKGTFQDIVLSFNQHLTRLSFIFGGGLKEENCEQVNLFLQCGGTHKRTRWTMSSENIHKTRSHRAFMLMRLAQAPERCRMEQLFM